MSERQMIFRVQDKDGRGPFKPGFSKHWLDHELHCQHRSWIEEFGLEILSNRKEGEYLACGCRSMQKIREWFSDSELERLRDFGYDIVTIDIDRVIAESDNQVVFARRRPLKFLSGSIAA